MNKENISVEIFRDVDCKSAPIEVAEAGIDNIRRVTTGIEIVRTTGLFRLALEPSSTPYLDVDTIKWPIFEADMNIVVTDRKLSVDGKKLHGTSFGRARVAVVSITGRATPEITAAHELAHLFSLKRKGETWDGAGHCKKTDCLMYHSPVPVEQKGFKRFLEYYGLRSVESTEGEDLCAECAKQLDMYSFFFKKAKAGEEVRPEWL